MEEKILKIPSDNKSLEQDLIKNIKKYMDNVYNKFTEELQQKCIPDSIRMFSFKNTDLQIIVKKESYIANIELIKNHYIQEEEYEKCAKLNKLIDNINRNRNMNT
jgi:hypothetical protein